MELNARTAPDGRVLEAEVCIVGAGPAGLSLAAELERLGRRVVLLESAGAAGPAERAELAELNVGETSGDPYPSLELVRARGMGGSATVWNTMLERLPYAKYIPLDPVDFEERAWLPWSGWPVDFAALEPWYRRAQDVAGLGSFVYRPAPDSLPVGVALPAGRLYNALHHYGAASRFTAELPAALARSASATLVAGATVTRLRTEGAAERVAAVDWATLAGTRGQVRASRFVLAAGAIENARLLLHFGQERGRGAAPPWLGAGFMEHPLDASLRLLSRAPELSAGPSFYAVHPDAGAPVIGRIGLAPELLRAERLLNASLRVFPEEEPALLRSPLAPLGRRAIRSARVRSVLGRAARGFERAARRVRGAEYRLALDLEQAPHPENRIVLGGRRDRFGVPRARLEWRWRPEDEAQRRRIRDVIVRELTAAGAGRVHVTPNAPLDPALHHHAGTTRMHQDPAFGVVDPELRVHGMENLYVAGASVFPTAGFANPTLTVLALSLRLAERLAS